MHFSLKTVKSFIFLYQSRNIDKKLTLIIYLIELF